MQSDHLHLGAGKLGVGLVLPTAIDAGNRIHLVTRADSALTEACALVCYIGDEKPRTLVVDSFSRADAVEQLHDDAHGAFVSAPGAADHDRDHSRGHRRAGELPD